MPAIRQRAAWTTAVTTLAVAAGLLTATPANAVVGQKVKDGSYEFTAKLDIGGERSCSAALVEQQWLLTAASCFADKPGSQVAPGAPKLKTMATIGRTDLTRGDQGTVAEVVELVPRDDRDLVMAKLANPVAGISPVKIATNVPLMGEDARITGYGRTKDEWAPDRLQQAAFTVNAVDEATLGLTSKDADAASCLGDAGAPAFREIGDRIEVVGVNSRFWQGGCLGASESETRKGVVDARVDNIAGWIEQIRSTTMLFPAENRTSGVYAANDNTSEVFLLGSDKQIYSSSYRTGSPGWNKWTRVSNGEFTSAPSAVYHADKNIVEVFAIGTDRQVYHSFHTPGSADWSGWQLVAPGEATGQLQTVYHADKRTIEVFAVGADRQIYHAWYTTGEPGWSKWNLVAPDRFTLINASYDVGRSTSSVFAIGTDGQIYRSAYKTGSSGWSRWQLIAPGTATALASVNHRDKQVTEIFALGTDQRIYHSWSGDGGNSWSGWDLIADGRFSALNAVYHADKKTTELFALGVGRQVYHSFYTTGAPRWSAWSPVAAGQFTSVPTAFYHTDKNTVEVLNVGLDGQVYHSFYTTGSDGWTRWSKLAS
ncbi:trypsin-like serine protease [Streptomyces gamaensis]|uniref:Trypsin-like serine protease n=1 Tax=Streptomyces gamaensis TaxID=1763542 RepID=A0ABW0Z094_9ACTN